MTIQHYNYILLIRRPPKNKYIMQKRLHFKKLTFGVCDNLIDLLIWQIALVGTSIGKSGPRGIHDAFREADQILSQINHKTLAATWYQLRKKKLLTYIKRKNVYNPQITDYGRKRIEETTPCYHKKRPWDKRIYLITYDIPEKSRKKRDKLRRFLIQLRCKLIQESVFLTPYNPRELIHNFDKKYEIPGTIIVSDVGRDGGIGETDIKDLLVNLYSLTKINERYEIFIKNTKRKNDKRMLLFEYLSILKDDPQLPFELLPKGWLGEKANGFYITIKKDYIFSVRGRLSKNI